MTARRLIEAAVVGFSLSAMASACAVYGRCESQDCQADAETTAAVRALFERQPAFGGPAAIDVRTVNHVVYLYGLVDTEMERRLAGSIALDAAGALHVVNLLGVHNGGR